MIFNRQDILIILSLAYIYYTTYQTINDHHKFNNKERTDQYIMILRVNQLLETSWISPHLNIDTSDSQYRYFRRFIPILTGFYTGCAVMYYFIRKWFESDQVKVLYHCLLGFGFLVALHGLNAVWVLGFVVVNYGIGVGLRGTRWQLYGTWGFNVVVLMLMFDWDFRGTGLAFLAFDGRWKGFIERWYIVFNVSVLRMISFNLDCYRFYKEREMGTAGEDKFNFLNYFAYVFYVPLYLTGPIITFNDFVNQFYSSKVEPKPEVMKYGLRLLGVIVLREILMHLFHVEAIIQSGSWKSLSSFEFLFIGYLCLSCVWMKLTIIWRFARFFSMLNGITPPENMLKCFSNSNTTSFWKVWHHSYHLWLKQYIYIPLGGSHNKKIAIPIVFGFVALWHELSLNLAIWSIGCVVLFALENLFQSMINKLEDSDWQYTVQVFTASFLFSAGCLVNMIGFVFGWKGVQKLWKDMSEFSYDPINVGVALLFILLINEFIIRQSIHNPEETEEEQSEKSQSSTGLRP
eukprot:TRINITY_DN2402_c0_g1_i1.p1 TRINITY_DN2402_c0_g1~~TRINITY_DN2402_c0_g1_i1.p1  ORF type:complete len:517 (+),score=65.48 TRINITY_DN2402_c0_g1_i1:41-1591(+)